MCAPGEYCGTGTEAATSCDPGRYCKDYAAGAPAGRCEAGYYCPLGASKANANPCPAGHYCREGSPAPTACAAGTYSESVGAADPATCAPCPPGYACLVSGLPSPYTADSSRAGPCPAGYYCTRGSDTNDPTAASTAAPTAAALRLCEPGYECPADSLVRKACQPGAYQDLAGQSSCKTCPAGSFCDGSDPTSHATCPAGSYCPAGSKHGQENPCPAGSYSASGQGSAGDCTPCRASHYCQFAGTSAERETATPVQAGYYGLTAGQTRPDPHPCPTFAYCPAGSAAPVACPDGTWAPWERATAAADCIPCPRGTFCKYATMYAEKAATLQGGAPAAYADPAAALGGLTFALYAGPCSPGYLCLEGASTASPTDGRTGFKCPAGTYCSGTAGATTAVPCAHGYFAATEGQASCSPCPAGTYCAARGTQQPGSCPAGHYCPSASAAPTPCPAGTYGAAAGLGAETACTACPAGSYCLLPGARAETGPCAAGYVCGPGASTATPWQAASAAGSTWNGGTVPHGRCPAGHYCPQGSGQPRSCPAGSYGPSPGAAECHACDPGKYCGLEGLTAPSGDCAGGYYCGFGASTPTPTDGTTGNRCPEGYYCPTGSPVPRTCPDGARTTAAGQSTCPPCASGQSCRAALEVSCDNYKYCQESEASAHPYGRLCPAGTYLEADERGVASPQGCRDCPAGRFCLAGRIAGDCAAGYLCKTKAGSPQPTGETESAALFLQTVQSGAYPCRVGYYCPAGTLAEQRCEGGLYTYAVGARQKEECTTCQGGYWCEPGRDAPQLCPEGHFCPPGSEAPTACPMYRYNANPGSANADECRPCSRGYYCSAPALGNLYAYGSRYRCPPGHFCPAGTR